MNELNSYYVPNELNSYYVPWRNNWYTPQYNYMLITNLV